MSQAGAFLRGSSGLSQALSIRLVRGLSGSQVAGFLTSSPESLGFRQDEFDTGHRSFNHGWPAAHVRKGSTGIDT